MGLLMKGPQYKARRLWKIETSWKNSCNVEIAFSGL